MKFLLASQNQHKKKEIFHIFEGHQIELVDLSYFNDTDDVEETGLTFSENALIKAKYYSLKYNMVTIADDSGLSVDALGGKPGVYSKRYSGGSDLDNNIKLLNEMKDEKNRKAFFTSAISIYFPDGKNFSFIGTVDGLIAYEMKGQNGFGYDSIFYVPELGKHMAELDEYMKNQISHRANALKEVKEHLDEIINYK